MNACATILAELDSRSYRRSLIQDANKITEQILQPMSLPWTHKVNPVARNIPCDIDEMIDVVTADDGSHTPYDNGNFGFGQFETGRPRSGTSLVRLANSSENFRSAARRSNDPGIIEYSMITLPSSYPSYHPEPLPPLKLQLYEDSNDFNDDNSQVEGSTILRCFEATQKMKRRKIDQARSNVSSYQISVKINSSSSRSSIFTLSPNEEDLQKNGTTITLEAILPLEVENGRRLSKTRAKEISDQLGSYDIHDGLSSLQQGKNSNRPLVGRTRLMWTSKGLTDEPQQFMYSSLLTGQKLGAGAERRPRSIRVRITVGGEIWHYRDDDCCLDPGEVISPSSADDRPEEEDLICNERYHNDENPQEMIAIKKSKRISRPSSRLKDAHFESMKPQRNDNSIVV